MPFSNIPTVAHALLVTFARFGKPCNIVLQAGTLQSIRDCVNDGLSPEETVKTIKKQLEDFNNALKSMDRQIKPTRKYGAPYASNLYVSTVALR